MVRILSRRMNIFHALMNLAFLTGSRKTSSVRFSNSRSVFLRDVEHARQLVREKEIVRDLHGSPQLEHPPTLVEFSHQFSPLSLQQLTPSNGTKPGSGR
ncbi:hypothetical protein OE766_22465 [Pararhizobium sp. YC-54]|uniref:hypothetical protein n=1 Tax=Pararhizobium sp. YC-54 TaxID=2986920 RepID=UPI0021F6FC44|nr:hypothetical protein [Pararhizobium sp. YC-54]MCW0001001.1 hypothetical protein [Pararhizobium sp. YC-54]